MAKVSLDLNQFKANGVYTVEYDESEQTVINSQQLRLIVGFSRKGPFNAPVFLNDTKSARKIFGGIDTLLEKKGSFFHRAIETALAMGPVYAINLLPLDNTPTGDKIEYRSFSLSMDESNSDTATALYSSFYNKERFWKPDTSYFEAIVNNNIDAKGKLISFTNLGQSPLSIIVRKAKSVVGFDITARDFYGEDNVPEFVNKFAYIRDYFIDIYAVKGDWTDYENLSIDPDYSKYFDNTGIKVNMLDKFLASDKITMIGSWTGCIIPDFVDQTGANQYIETIVNSSQQLTGVYMAINRDALEDYANSTYHVDLIGNSLLGDNVPACLNMLSYTSPLIDEIVSSSKNDEIPDGDTYAYEVEDFGSGGEYYPYVKHTAFNDEKGHFFNTLVIPKPKNEFAGQVFTLEKYNEILEKVNSNSLVKTKEDKAKVYSVTNTGDSIEIVIMPKKDENKAALEEFTTIKVANNGAVEFIGLMPEVLSGSPAQDSAYAFIKSARKYTKIVKENDAWKVPVHESETIAETWWADLNGIVKNKPLEVIFQSFDTDYADIIAAINDGEDVASGSIVINKSIDAIESVDEVPFKFRVYPGNELFKQIKNNSITTGDKFRIEKDGTFNYLAFKEENDEYGLPVYDIYQYQDEGLVTYAEKYVGDGETFSYKAGSDEPVKPGEGEKVAFCIVSDHNTISESVKYETINNARTEITISKANGSKIEVGQYLVSEKKDKSKVLTRVISKTKEYNTETNTYVFKITTNEPIFATTEGTVTRYLDINDEKFTTNLQFTVLNGFMLTEYHLPNDTDDQIAKIYGVLEDTNVGKTLADNDIIQFRYIIDTFDGGINNMMGPKVILSRLAMKKQKCMALLNAPSMKKFTESVDPRFTDAPDPENGIPKPVLNCEYIAAGGNLSLGPSKKFTLPDDDNGAKFTGVFSPFIKIREFNKDKMVPPAADVSNNFIKKFKTGQSYAIAAGPRRGIISNPNMTGLEYEYLKEERGYVEPVGINCLIDDKQYGPMIYGNATAYQKTLTAFNNLHVRDLLITIETDIEDILSGFVFEFNDAATRLAIKTLVTSYLENVRASQGIYDFIVIMDETNNTPTVIDQNIGILDIGIEPARGMHKIINRVTVLKTGTISSGGFTIN